MQVFRMQKKNEAFQSTAALRGFLFWRKQDRDIKEMNIYS